ncbi:hypothetical protein TR13x_08960 [Caloranaerobacter sp. TR13]|uniref:hypothetical protein n=1 Tax=Caloranaerobacter sp. TR13 TaxID=1302151 RepID=UPI0006D4350F|nr:hypothetical protein [Caloranaerobacter sp. TR13]KPU26697.1 hypothetical protein TR13x_08960 [Caloranaerobacter sp. TR13]
MYASYTFTVLSKVWEKVNNFYEYSLLNKIHIKIKGTFKRLSRGSLLVAFLTHESTILESSFLCRLYYTIVDIINNLLRKLNIFFTKSFEKSFIYRVLAKICSKCFKNLNLDLQIIIKNSYFIRIITYIFTLDEDNGGEKWW